MSKVFRTSRIIWLNLAILALSVFIPGSAHALSPYISGSTGVDVSWPNQNCRTIEKMPPQTAFGIIGVNHGLDFTINNCLQQEASSLSDYSLYLNTGYPGISYGHKYQSFPEHCSPRNNECLAFNYGYNAARFSIDDANLNNIHSTHWWLDVETDNSWTNNTLVNVAALRGMVSGIKKYTVFSTIGIYSFPGQWYQLTGDWQNGLLVWMATGTYERSSAIASCTEPSFTGGRVLLTQYTFKLDEDYAC